MFGKLVAGSVKLGLFTSFEDKRVIFYNQGGVFDAVFVNFEDRVVKSVVQFFRVSFEVNSDLLVNFSNFIISVRSGGGNIFVFLLGLVVLKVQYLDQVFSKRGLGVFSVIDFSK